MCRAHRGRIRPASCSRIERRRAVATASFGGDESGGERTVSCSKNASATLWGGTVACRGCPNIRRCRECLCGGPAAYSGEQGTPARSDTDGAV